MKILFKMAHLNKKIILLQKIKNKMQPLNVFKKILKGLIKIKAKIKVNIKCVPKPSNKKL